MLRLMPDVLELLSGYSEMQIRTKTKENDCISLSLTHPVPCNSMFNVKMRVVNVAISRS